MSSACAHFETQSHKRTIGRQNLAQSSGWQRWHDDCFDDFDLTRTAEVNRHRSVSFFFVSHKLRALSGTLLLLVCLGLGCALFGPPQVRRHASMDMVRPKTGWRRTVDGWEDCATWNLSSPGKPNAASIHPMIIAGFELLATLGGLLALADED